MNEDYSQPTFYHFSEDSVLLAKWAATLFPNARSLVDVCAGCGVVGIEVARLIPITHVDFVELQEDFQEMIYENINKFLSENVETNVYIGPLSTWVPCQKYDLIVANPPYFLPQSGEASKNQKRHKARCLVVDDWEMLIQKVALAMHSTSHALFVIRQDEKLLSLIQKACFEHGLETSSKYEKKLVFLDIFTLNKNGNKDRPEF